VQKVNDENIYLMPGTGSSSLIINAGNEKLFNEALSVSKEMLAEFNMSIVSSEYKNDLKLGIVKYTSPDGLAIRSFLAEKLDYDALKPEAVEAVRGQLEEALGKAGLSVAGVFYINNSSAFRNTVNIFYVTKFNAKTEKEIQLRSKQIGAKEELEMVKNYITPVRYEDNKDLVTYIGSELGFKSKLATSEKEAAGKLADYKKYLKDNNYNYVDSKTIKLEEPFTVGDKTYTYLLDMYFMF